MIKEYIEAALARATFKIIRDEEPHYGEIPTLGEASIHVPKKVAA